MFLWVFLSNLEKFNLEVFLNKFKSSKCEKIARQKCIAKYSASQWLFDLLISKTVNWLGLILGN